MIANRWGKKQCKSASKSSTPIHSLAKDQRATLLLVVLEGLSYREAAEVQGVAIGTVMSRLTRARAHIKDCLDGGRPALRLVRSARAS